MKKSIIVLVCLVLLGVAGWIFWTRTHTPPTAEFSGVLRGGYLEGNVVNGGEQTINASRVEATFVGANGAVIGSGSAEVGRLQPGQSAPVQLAAPSGASSFSVTVTSRSGVI